MQFLAEILRKFLKPITKKIEVLAKSELVKNIDKNVIGISKLACIPQFIFLGSFIFYLLFRYKKEEEGKIRKIRPGVFYKLLYLVKLGLYAVCFYSATPYSDNPVQAAYRHKYYEIMPIYFTRQSLYLTLVTGLFSFLNLNSPQMYLPYSILLPTTLINEFVLTLGFWFLFTYKPSLIVHRRFLKDPMRTPFIQEMGLHLFPLIFLILDQADITILETAMQKTFLFSFLFMWGFTVILLQKIKGVYLYGFMIGAPTGIEACLWTPFIIFGFYLLYSAYINLKSSKKVQNSGLNEK